jgi:FtsP/CotA-like multicopper oxidase with cupredoxin domain
MAGKKENKVQLETTPMKIARKTVSAGLALAALCLGINQGAAQTYGPNPNVNYDVPNYANSPILRKFVDSLPGLTAANANNLGQYIPVATPDTTTYPGCDYYEIGVVEYREKMHSDLPGGSRLRGYVQLATDKVPGSFALQYLDGTPVEINGSQAYAVEAPHYLGPLIVATANRPTRLKMYNLLPFGVDGQGNHKGDLFIPVDRGIMGTGVGPLGGNDRYEDNRVTIHLHGGNTPWISDGTAHQWTVPAGEVTVYPKGVSSADVPDMGATSQGVMTFYYPNQQSSRLLFYHDHALGITALNVYAGVAAGYLLTDEPGKGENSMASVTSIPQVPLILQDKSFVHGGGVPQAVADDYQQFYGQAFPPGSMTPATLDVDPLWPDAVRGSQNGDLWFPHVYMVNQDPFSPDGFSAYGRWDYGPWFWPIFPPLYDLPTVSHVPEAFQDTPVINGTAYPYAEVPAGKVRFRILNAANDRFFNLQLYVADSTGTNVARDAAGKLVTADTAASFGTEVQHVPFNRSQDLITPFPAHWYDTGLPFTLDDRDGGVPDPNTRGPAFVQIGTEGGLLPEPAVIVNQPINYDYDRRSVTVLGISKHAMFVGPAERADVIVDFAPFAGKTLILYNDAPAPVPASLALVDYYTGNMDLTGAGGAPSTLPGYGNNTRTMMQIRVAADGGISVADPKDYVDATWLATLKTELAAAFREVQPAPIVPQPAFNLAFNTTFVETYSRISNNFLAFSPYANGQTLTRVYVANPGANYTANANVKFTGAGLPQAGITLNGAAIVNPTTKRVVSIVLPPTLLTDHPEFAQMNATPKVEIISANGVGIGATARAVTDLTVNQYIESKAIHELFDEFGRMNTILGTELPFTTAFNQTTIPLKFVDPPTEILADGTTQLWKITHNGVDTHPIHFHLFDVQVINRMGWDNAVKPPDANEVGWKDTVRMNPLEDIVVAMRAKKQNLPWPLPNNIRPYAPTLPLGSTLEFTGVNPTNNVPMPVQNIMYDFGWEYTWHCHILGHEENDMMRPMVLRVGLELTTTTLPDAGIGLSYMAQVVAMGGTTPYTFSLAAGSLPPGLGIAANGLITGVPSGLPATYNFTLRVTDANAKVATKDLSIRTTSVPVITTATVPNAEVGTPYSAALQVASGLPPYQFTIAGGALPPGLTLNAGSGVISGTPTLGGTYNFIVQVNDSQVPSSWSVRGFTLIVAYPALVIDTASPLPDGLQDSAYTPVTLAATGGRPGYTWSATGLPNGMTVSAAGVLSGTPTAGGSYTVAVTVSDTQNPVVSTTKNLALKIAYLPVTVSTASLPNGGVNVAYTTTLAATGGNGSYTWTRTAGTLPPGLTLAANGTISGTPTTANTYNFTVRATDTQTPTAAFGEKALSITILPRAASPGYLTVPENVTSAGSIYLLAGTVATPGAQYVFEYKLTTATTWTVYNSGSVRNPTITGFTPGVWQFRVYVTAPGYWPSAYRNGGNNATVSNVALAPGFLTPTYLGNGKVNFNAGASATPGVYYRFQQSTDGGNTWSLLIEGPNRNPTNVSLGAASTPAATHSFRVQAYDPNVPAVYTPSPWRNATVTISW